VSPRRHSDDGDGTRVRRADGNDDRTAIVVDRDTQDTKNNDDNHYY